MRLFEEAQGYLNEATRLDPKSSIARETYGDLLLVQGRSEEAIREYDFTKQLNPRQKSIDAKIKHAKAVNRDLQKQMSIATKKRKQDSSVQAMSFEDEINEAREIGRAHV